MSYRANAPPVAEMQRIGKVKCYRCAKRAGIAKENPPRIMWETVDWSTPDHEIALLMGVRVEAVRKQMINRGVRAKLLSRGRPKLPEPDLSGADWSKNNSQLAEEFGTRFWMIKRLRVKIGESPCKRGRPKKVS